MKTRLLSELTFGALVGLLGIIALALPQTALAGPADPALNITVRVENHSQISPAALAAAEHEAGRILSEAGLRAVWLECVPAASAPVPQVPCQKASEASDIRLRILSAPTQNKFDNSVFGIAVHPALASVYYEYVVRRAKSEGVEFGVPVILGCLIAHELGHLLLGPNGHSGEGIMRGQWGPKQVHVALMGGLLFTSQQSKLMQLEARTRSARQTVTSASTPVD